MLASTQAQGTCPDNTISSGQAQAPEMWGEGVLENFMEGTGMFGSPEARYPGKSQVYLGQKRVKRIKQRIDIGEVR